MKKTVKLGVIGCGAMGARHVVTAGKSDRLEVVAVADAVGERAHALAAEHGIPKAYEGGLDLLKDGAVEAVVLALPTAIRSPLALAAFQHGKHVLLEKPSAMNVGDLEGLIAARGKLVGACCSSRYRLLPSAERVTEFLKTGALGPLRSLVIREFQRASARPMKEKPAWRLSRALNGGGILVNWGSYDLDFILGLTGWAFEPRWVLAQTWPVAPMLASHVHPDSDAEAHLAALIRGADGSVLHIERGEYAAIQADSLWEIIGTNGSLRLPLRPGPGKVVYHDFLDPETGFCSEVLWEGDEEGEGLTGAPLLDFAEAILVGRDPATTLEQALVLQKIVDAIYESAEQARPVALS